MINEINLGTILPTVINLLRGQQNTPDSQAEEHANPHDSFELCAFTDAPTPQTQIRITGASRRQIEAAILRLLDNQANITDVNATLSASLTTLRNVFRQGQTTNSPININSGNLPDYIQSVQDVISAFGTSNRPSARRIAADARALLPLLQGLQPQPLAHEGVPPGPAPVRARPLVALPPITLPQGVNMGHRFNRTLHNIPGEPNLFIYQSVWNSDLAIKLEDGRYLYAPYDGEAQIWDPVTREESTIEINNTPAHAQYRNARARIEAYRTLRNFAQRLLGEGE